MSLLPNAMLPPAEPIGTVNPDGSVSMEKTWWLLMFSMASQVFNGSLATEAMLDPDPVPAAQPAKGITVGASPFLYIAPFSGSIIVTAGTVTSVAIIRQGLTMATGANAGMFPVSRLDTIQVIYTAAPGMFFLPT